MTDSIELKKMYWHSRRGMLELDLILVPFAENRLAGQSNDMKLAYARLLEEEDQDIYQWLVKRMPVPDPGLEKIIRIIMSD